MADSKRQWSRVIWGPYTEDLKEAVHTICLRCLHPSAAWLLCVIWRPLPRIIWISDLFVSLAGQSCAPQERLLRRLGHLHTLQAKSGIPPKNERFPAI